MNLDGMPLRYLIGADDDDEGNKGHQGEVTEVNYDVTAEPAHGFAIKYGNLFDEKNSGDYGPYLEPGDTAGEYNEGQIDPKGQGWNDNLDDQFHRAISDGFTCIELDNADSYDMQDVLKAVDRCEAAGLYTVAKNPMICRGGPEGRQSYVMHDAVIGCIVERDCGAPGQMERLRQQAMKPTLPVWFVSFGAGRAWAEAVADEIRTNDYVNMGVTYSDDGEYGSSEDILRPVPPANPTPEPGEPPVVTITIRTKGNPKVVINRIDE